MGADIECRDKDDDSPLFEAVRYSNSAMVAVLLRHGARADYSNKYGQTVLHIAAQWADVRTVELLAEARLQGLSTANRDCKGKTATEVFATRTTPPPPPPPPPGFEDAFGKLVDQVRRSEAAEEEDGPNEQDVFVDAVEMHDLVGLVDDVTLVEH
jgi:Ankyrin repeats (3 copies)